MTGDSPRSEDPDFLDDDFVVEDLAGQNDDLEQLFAEPSAAQATTTPLAPASAAGADSDDLLFTDHTEGLQPSESFQGRAAFAEDAKATWKPEELDLEAEAALTAASETRRAPREEDARLAEDDEELALDSENELELVDGPAADSSRGGAPAPDIVVGDAAAAAAEQEETTPEEVVDGIWEAVEAPVMAESADVEASNEPGWEPLPEASVDELAEVGELAPAEGGDELPADELADIDGHDIYTEDATPVLVGPRPGRRGLRLAAALAASLAVVGGAAVVVMRPEWLGIELEPQRVQQVQIERPVVQVVVAAPRAPVPQVGQATGETPAPATESPLLGPDQPEVEAPAAAHAYEVAIGPELPAAATPTVAGVPLPPEGLANPPFVVPVPSSPTPWPVAVAPREPQPSPRAAERALVRIGENLMVGEAAQQAAPFGPVEGVIPGMRAFAQLRNGNYFIGSVKSVAPDRVTLRLGEGEVTLVQDELTRLTQLGSADYEALQRVTAGSIRLTNNNRLVGGILSQIADDHVVLEFRSNRVMLPKSAVGQVVQGDVESSVRLDVTREEDHWLRQIAERELGNGKGATPPPAPAGGRQQ